VRQMTRLDAMYLALGTAVMDAWDRLPELGYFAVGKVENKPMNMRNAELVVQLIQEILDHDKETP
jgi:hypothetical protein